MAVIEQHKVDSKVEDYPRHEAVAVSVLPDCDICRFVENRIRPERALYDGRTDTGQWANMCHPHFVAHCNRLGLGNGQRLVIPGLGESMSRHPAGRLLRSAAV
jgi:hypothetical protein